MSEAWEYLDQQLTACRAEVERLRAAVPVLADPPAAWDLDVWVPGKAVPKGSTRAITRKNGVVVTVADNHDAQQAWKPVVQVYVRRSWGYRPVTAAPVAVDLDFVLPRRASAPKTFTPPHTRKPDIDKLSRMILDALTAVVWADDAQVTRKGESKREAEPGEEPGVRIRLAVLAPPPRPARSTRTKAGNGVVPGGPDAP